MSNFGFQYQMQKPIPANLTIPNTAPILFDLPLVTSDPFISYNPVTGIFTFSGSGQYLVEWFVSLKSGLGNFGPTITLVETAPNKLYPSTNYMKSGQLNGSALVSVSNGSTITLQNQTGNSLVLADNVAIVANIVITRISQDLQGIGLELTNLSGGSLTDNSLIAFNSTPYSTLSTVISNAAGVITLSVAGVYLFDWHVAINGSDTFPDGVKFQLQDANTNAVLGQSSNVVVTPEGISGTAILETTTANVPVKLVNVSGGSITYADLSLQATLRIFTIV
jgi:hypothetical protein